MPHRAGVQTPSGKAPNLKRGLVINFKEHLPVLHNLGMAWFLGSIQPPRQERGPSPRRVTSAVVFPSYPSALPGDELVVLRLHAGPAAHVEVFGLEVGVVQLLRSLQRGRREEAKATGSEQDDGHMNDIRYQNLGGRRPSAGRRKELVTEPKKKRKKKKKKITSRAVTHKSHGADSRPPHPPPPSAAP
ncbi:hypothetical protein EYF80_034578 [Liparis tanakae]|uniref:Uncharacterized protein n=1 Tax=Liparis tanakae TaxID=230148 RepID=A0A4Z2GQ44_9TELE|nr:hypothetical protein EYF80_034578 [Liparis tanakae]